MEASNGKESAGDRANNAGVTPGKDRQEQREIKGGLPYTTSPGVLKKALDAIIAAERPEKFSANYMETVLNLSGGSARAVPPFLKKMQFITGDGTPTPLYSKFKTEGGRTQAAYDGLRHAFVELFKRNEYAHKADENAVKDLIVEITGLKKTDPIIRLIYASFEAVRGFITGEVSSAPETTRPDQPIDTGSQNEAPRPNAVGVGLSYQINIVLPETDNIAVFNSIFRSLRENLLR